MKDKKKTPAKKVKAGREKKTKNNTPEIRGGAKQKHSKKTKKSDVRKIYKTTDGFFTGNSKITKPRRVAVIDQRKDDKAVALVKIFSKKGKTSDRFVEGVTLKPKRHKSLTEKSVVENEVRFGIKDKKGKFKAIYPRDLKKTNDRLTKKEHRAILEKGCGKTEKNKETTRKKTVSWKKHFRK